MSDKCWKIDLREIHDVLITLAKEAGAMITGAKPVVEGVGSKKNCKSIGKWCSVITNAVLSRRSGDRNRQSCREDDFSHFRGKISYIQVPWGRDLPTRHAPYRPAHIHLRSDRRYNQLCSPISLRLDLSRICLPKGANGGGSV